MGRIITIFGLALFAWWAYPHLEKGQWFAPTPLPPQWAPAMASPEYDVYTRPEEGYGVYRFDLWNKPPVEGRSIREEDFELRPLKKNR
jgi:hypothetical protein